MKTLLKIALIILGTMFIGVVGFVVFIGVVLSQIAIKPAIQPESGQLNKTVTYQACYEGTQNQADLFFRTDHTFDLNWTAAFGFDRWWLGTWTQQGDTLRLTYKGEVNKRLGKTLLINQYRLTLLDSVEQKAVFFLGGCPGLN